MHAGCDRQHDRTRETIWTPYLKSNVDDQRAQFQFFHVMLFVGFGWLCGRLWHGAVALDKPPSTFLVSPISPACAEKSRHGRSAYAMAIYPKPSRRA